MDEQKMDKAREAKKEALGALTVREGMAMLLGLYICLVISADTRPPAAFLLRKAADNLESETPEWDEARYRGVTLQ